MAFKKVTDLSADTTISLGGTNRKTGKKNPDSIEGYYLGSRKVDDKKKKDGFSYIHTFQTSKGNVGVWGKTDLDRKLLTVTPGLMVRATFDRMVPTPNGEMYKYEVAVDDENTTEVSQNVTNIGNGYGGQQETDDNSYVSQDEEGEDGEGVDEDALQAAALVQAEKKAKLDALLKKGNKLKN